MKFNLEFETTVFDVNEIKTILACLGQRIGFGVWTPSSPKPGTHGKFLIKSLKWLNSKTKEVKTIEIIDK